MNMEVPIAAAAVREPRQGRSRASFERMLAAAEGLMAERGSDEFTLAEVARTGKVSIGSIYCRFAGKDELVRAVQVRVLERVDADQAAMVARVRAEARDLRTASLLLVGGLAESLRRHAGAMRPLMQRASADPVVAATGKSSYAKAADAFHAAVLEHRAEIGHPEPERAVQSAFRIAYAAIARYLGFGTSTDASWEGDWSVLKEDLGRMVAAFLADAPRA